METAIRLCYNSPILRLSNCYKGSSSDSSNPSRFIIHHKTTSFNHASICASNFPTLLHPVFATGSFRRANCAMPNRSSSAVQPDNNDDKNGEIGARNGFFRGLARTSLVLACVLGLFNFNGKMMSNPMFNNAAYASWFSPGGQTPSQLPGGQAALESLFKTIEAQEPFKPNKNPTKYIRSEPDDNEVKTLKMHAVGLSKSGDQGKKNALQLLETECNKFKGTSAEFSLEMALVELRIFQGEYTKASEQLERQIDNILRENSTEELAKDKVDQLLKISDDFAFLVAKVAKLLLYKAVIETMLGKKEAAKWWEAFGKILDRNDGLSPI